MGYFSNGTQGDMYEEEYCSKCVNNDQEKGCPVIMLHMHWNYEQNRQDEVSKIKKFTLDWFIPQEKGGIFNDQCLMFKPNTCGSKNTLANLLKRLRNKMSQIIKFRQPVFDLITRNYFVSWHYWGFINGEFTPPNMTVNEDLQNSQQFTGLQDKNGKDIYEGDILLTDEAGWIGKVEYNHDRFMVVDNEGGFSELVNWNKCEKIGNIYQDSHLKQ